MQKDDEIDRLIEKAYYENDKEIYEDGRRIVRGFFMDNNLL